MALDPNKETFVIYITIVTSEITIHPKRKTQIALLKTKKSPVFIPAKYSDFTNIFFKELAKVLIKYIKINTHAINLEEGKQPSYRPIYSLGPVKLKILKTYIKIKLANGFICLSKSPTGVLILFDQKSDGNLQFCIDYQGFNKFTIKNWYPLLFIGEFLNWPGRAKRFIQLDLTSAYYWIKIKESDKWKMAFQT